MTTSERGAKDSEAAKLKAENQELVAETTAQWARINDLTDQVIDKLKAEREELIKLVTEPVAAPFEPSPAVKELEARMARLEVARDQALEREADALREVDSARQGVAQLAAVETQSVQQFVDERNLRKQISKFEAKADQASGEARGAESHLAEATAELDRLRVADAQRYIVEDEEQLVTFARHIEAVVSRRLQAHVAIAGGAAVMGLNRRRHSAFTQSWDLVEGQGRKAGVLEALGLGLWNFKINTHSQLEDAKHAMRATERAHKAIEAESPPSALSGARAAARGS